jgi:hypothetical protein
MRSDDLVRHTECVHRGRRVAVEASQALGIYAPPHLQPPRTLTKVSQRVPPTQLTPATHSLQKRNTSEKGCRRH